MRYAIQERHGREWQTVALFDDARSALEVARNRLETAAVGLRVYDTEKNTAVLYWGPREAVSPGGAA